jgi:hypothetical protein
MKHSTILVCLLVSSTFAAPAPMCTFTPLDIQPTATRKLKDKCFHDSDPPGNNLAHLPTGRHTFADIPFTIGEGLIQLSGVGNPGCVEGIVVGQRFAKLYLLLGTAWSAESEEKIEIAYGKDVRDWHAGFADDDGVTRSQLAWRGDNALAQTANHKIRLYVRTWENPKPDEKVISIDFISARTGAAPFCVAMTTSDR